ncbi:hypothetical protein [Peribacillus frigoritolerans]|uniref:hypothetical protein n=1 Tax=Peribacillus frigoritolerans TaxID=450367 RepID=UPI002E1CD9CE|nr:hypothetical protein [Peribacillus frigoritolerans]MED3845657.1 hypothetical protein [Peribacillus frigoritolerans]WVN11871.1 hypothetical protein V2I71_04465 [Peribacillus frigoritolerans]
MYLSIHFKHVIVISAGIDGMLEGEEKTVFFGRKGEIQHVFPGRRNHLFVHRARFHNGTDETGDFRKLSISTFASK